jgi:hypothetical protein
VDRIYTKLISPLPRHCTIQAYSGRGREVPYVCDFCVKYNVDVWSHLMSLYLMDRTQGGLCKRYERGGEGCV